MAVITLSRQYGSPGDEIAARVCEKLGYRMFNKVLMAQMATEVDLAPGEIVDFSEDDYKIRSFMERLFILDNPRVVAHVGTWQETASGRELEEVRNLDEETAIGLIQNTIRAAHKHGNVVIVGRGAQAILKGQADVLHVRIVAPFELRTKYLQEQANLHPKAGQEVLAERDKASAEYLKRFYDLDWDDSLLYDLVINTAKWQVDDAAAFIADAVSRLSGAG